MKENIFENFYSSLYTDFLTEATKTKKNVSPKNTAVSTKRLIKTIGRDDATRQIADELTSSNDNTVKDYSIVSFLLSDSFFSYLKSLQGDRIALRSNVMLRNTNKPTDAPATNITDPDTGNMFNIGYRIPLLTLLNIMTRNIENESEPEKSKIAVKYLITLYLIFNDKNYRQLEGVGERFEKYAEKLDNVCKKTKTILFKNKDEAKNNSKNRVLTFPEALSKILDNLLDKNYYAGRQALAYDEILKIRNSKDRLNNDEADSLKSFMDSDFAADHRLIATSSDGARHIDANGLFSYLLSIGITMEKLKDCLAFNINIIDHATSEMKRNPNEKDRTGFVPTKLIRTAITDELPDLSRHNKYLRKLIDGKRTLNDIIGLNNIFYDTFSDIKSSLASNPDGITTFAGHPYLQRRMQQLTYLAQIERSAVVSVADLYMKLAKIFIYVTDVGLPPEFKIDHKTILSMPNTAPGASVYKNAIDSINRSQTDVMKVFQSKNTLWTDVLERSELFARNETSNIRGETTYQMYNPIGVTMNLTVPSDNLFHTIDMERSRYSFREFNATDYKENEPDSVLDISNKTHVIPENPKNYETDVQKLIQQINQLSSIQDVHRKSVVSVQLWATQAAMDNFIAKVKNVDTIDRNDFGTFINDHLNYNVTLRFRRTQNTGVTSENFMDDTIVKRVIYSMPSNNGKSKTSIQTLEIETPLFTTDVYNATKNMDYMLSRASKSYGSLKMELADNRQRMISEIKSKKSDATYSDYLRRVILFIVEYIKNEVATSSDRYSGSLAEKQKENAVEQANSIYSPEKIEKFLNYASTIFVLDTEKFPVNEDIETSNDEKLRIIEENLANMSAIILFDYLAFCTFSYDLYEETESELPKKTKIKSLDELDSSFLDKKTDAVFSTIKTNIQNSYKNAQNISSNRSLDQLTNEVLAKCNEFSRIVNSITRKTLSYSMIWASSDSVFAELRSDPKLFNRAINFNVGDKTTLESAIIDAIQNILNTTRRVYQTDRTSIVGEISVDLNKIKIEFVPQTDAATIVQAYTKIANINSINEYTFPQRAFNDCNTAENTLKAAYDAINRSKSFNIEEKILISKVILFYYIMCIVTYEILLMNQGLIFDDDNPIVAARLRTLRIEPGKIERSQSWKNISKPQLPTWLGSRRHKLMQNAINRRAAPAPTPPPAPAATPPAAPATPPTTAPTPVPGGATSGIPTP